jgi:hypothetical protein
MGTSKIVKCTFNNLGGRFDGIRFKTPPGETVHLNWMLAYPPKCYNFEWFILPMKGKMTRFTGGGRPQGPFANVPWPDNYSVIQQSLDNGLRGGEEYVIWFAFHYDQPAEFYVALNLFPNVTNTVAGEFGIKKRTAK